MNIITCLLLYSDYCIIVKVGYNYFIIFQYYYLNTCLKILKFYENFKIKIKKNWKFYHFEIIWNLMKILNFFEIFWKFWTLKQNYYFF
jgi:hypothetical protein